jgi:hypothetical protein
MKELIKYSIITLLVFSVFVIVPAVVIISGEINKTTVEEEGYLEKYDISEDLANQLSVIFPLIDIDEEKIVNIERTNDWYKGERYSVMYEKDYIENYQLFIYLNKDKIVESINYGDIKLYEIVANDNL